MSEPERAESPSASARSTHVVHFHPTSWPDTAARIAPLVARVDADRTELQVLVLVPAAQDALDLARALQDGESGRAVRIAPLSTPRRARRLAGDVMHVAVATPAVVQSLMSGSILRLQGVTGVAITGAGELEPEAAALDAVLAELPRGVARTLVAAEPSPFVERIIASHLHGARRLRAAPATPGAAGPTIEIVPVGAAASGAALADVLEFVDAPSAAVVPADPARERAARDTLAALGYAPDAPLARVAPDGATGGAALLVLLGAPDARQWAAALAAPPARIVAIVSTRERAALGTVAPAATLVPFAPSAARDEAAAAEAALRDRIRRAAQESFPAREMLALEPLLAEFDALVLAGAAVRLLERERQAARRAAEARPAAAGADARGPRDVRPGSGARSAGRVDSRDRPPRRDDRGAPARPGTRGRPERPARPGPRPRDRQ